MTVEQLNVVFAERIMGWRVAADRFLLGNRSWLARWRFQPCRKLEDAFRLSGAYTERFPRSRDGNSVKELIS